MRKTLFLAAAALLFGLAPLAARLDPVLGALLLVGLGVLLALAASGTASALAVTGGALGAFAFGAIAPFSSAAAGAALLGLCFAERTSRVRDAGARWIHLAASIGAGALAAAIALHVATSAGPRAAAVIVAAVLAALPLLIDADDPLAHALDAAAAELTGPVAASLASGAELRRAADEARLDRPMKAPVRQTWISLLKLADARARLARSRDEPAPHAAGERALRSPALAVIERLDARIAEHVAVLSRAHASLDEG